MKAEQAWGCRSSSTWLKRTEEEFAHRADSEKELQYPPSSPLLQNKETAHRDLIVAHS
jgi:hypothetical protein